MQVSPIGTSPTFKFAHQTMSERLPNLLKTLQANNDFSPYISRQLDDLYKSMRDNDPMPAPTSHAPDSDLWLADWQAYEGQRWQESYWYLAEMHFFREVINRVQYWQNGQDPYLTMKQEELYSEGLKAQLEYALSIQGDPDSVLSTMLELALWGNRADLSLPEVVGLGQQAAEDDLLIDNRLAVIEAINQRGGAVHLITDNFGTELAMDLMLIYHLLQRDIPVIVHVKMNPTYVSDANASDVLWMLNTLPEIVPDAKRHVDALNNALNIGKLQLFPHFFWHTSRWYNQLPKSIFKGFALARVIISKGDANYRRAMYDTIWDTEQSLTKLVKPLPAPFLALRTLKSDPIVGLSPETMTQLDENNPNWRTSGKYGIIQFSA